MPPAGQSHARSHALLLFQKLLNLRDSASPLTLVLDTLEQSGRPVLREFIARAKVSRSKIIYLSFATLRKPADVEVFVKARGKSLDKLRSEIVSHYPPASAAGNAQKVLLVVDTLNPLSSTSASHLPHFLSSLITTPAISLVGLYHTDVPLVLPKTFGEYEPHPLTVLCHLATAILRVGSLYQAIKRKEARNRSLADPEWGLNEGREGVLIGLKGGKGGAEGLVIDMEIRRRSGRSVGEKFVLIPSEKLGLGGASRISLLNDHPMFKDPVADDVEIKEGGDEAETTFSLGLTEKQKRDREGIVLPYFDAQTDIGAGEGGRILYEMGREDDFDDEEDEI
ncbi:putative Elongator complex protein 5 [Seiridium unicorne]|uniref:Elongator complex protein 5 n=1 Tax=Seiridium unicorne TaxID=138068 RepID=A0ABR2UZI6_9PEZI